MAEVDTSLTYYQETQTLVGERKRQLMDMDSGEVILVDQITKRVYGTKAFWKVYLMDFLMVLGIIDSKQLDVFIHIVENTDPGRNLFIGTYDMIGKETGVSRQTIAKIMKKLQANNFIRKRQQGVWRVNPNILMKGDDTRRQILLSYYESQEPVNELSVNRQRRTRIDEQLPGQMSINDYPEALPEEAGD
jgi:predicted transcriptional regulator